MAFGALAYDPMTGLPIGAEEAPPNAPVEPSFGPGNTQLAGTYLGGLEQSLPREVLFPDFFKERRAKGLPKLADDRAFSMSNVSQLATQEWLDTVMKVMEANKGASRQKIITLLEDAYAGMPAAGAEKLDWHDLIDKPKEN